MADQLIARVTAIDAATGWFEVRAQATSGWIIRRYIDAVVTCPTQPVTPAGTDRSYVIGCWNLEHCNPDSKRGFPENTKGGPTYPPRSSADYAELAGIIEEIDAKLLVLSEIAGSEETDDDGNEVSVSRSLDDLIAVLGSSNYGYVIGTSGGKQRLALLYDRRAIRVNTTCETDFPKIKVQQKSVFDRQPLMAHVTLLHEGHPMNDLLVVGVHLASGQHLTDNHDRAMQLLVDWIETARTEAVCLPSTEMDVFIAGDFNANRFDDKDEEFWDLMETTGWDVLADDGTQYAATRLSGVPLALRESQIDYVIISAGAKGLKGQEVAAATATVHAELIGGDPDRFRAHASDHLPVTVPVRVVTDDD
jgi:endonuclease/exonuclease/phosphatase family metal-dependent hydrolase